MTAGQTEFDDASQDQPANVVPHAVKDPNVKTEGKPGLGPQGEATGECDPGGG